MHFDQVNFGCRVRALRKSRNLTQEQLSAVLHISIDHLGKIEVGKRGISIDLLLDLSEALEVSLDFLVKGDINTRTDAKGLIRQMRILLDQLEMVEKNPD